MLRALDATAAIKPISVLLIEDDDDTRLFAAELLRMDGFDVVEAHNGRRALDLLLKPEAFQPEVIVMDLQMPVMSGWELMVILKSHAHLEKIPVIVLSAFDLAPEAKRWGMATEYLQKPWRHAELAAIVKRFARPGDAPSSPQVR